MRPAALVTGAAKRVGKGIALSLAEYGFDIALHYNHSEKEARETAGQIRKLKRRCELFSASLSDETEVENLIPEVRKAFPHFSLLINSASTFKKSKLLTSDISSFEEDFAINFKAHYLLSVQFAKHIRRGQIVNMLETHIVHNRTERSHYLLSKKALAAFTNMAALEFAPNIRVNGIAPGYIMPPNASDKAYLARLKESIPLKRRGNVGFIAHAIRFLIENEYVTGQVLFVDGGEHLL